ncbi:7711_t:CDS:2, partial [Diversispora eburnea]
MNAAIQRRLIGKIFARTTTWLVSSASSAPASCTPTAPSSSTPSASAPSGPIAPSAPTPSAPALSPVKRKRKNNIPQYTISNPRRSGRKQQQVPNHEISQKRQKLNRKLMGIYNRMRQEDDIITRDQRDL